MYPGRLVSAADSEEVRAEMVYLTLACRILLGAVFLSAVFSKIRSRSAFDSFVAGLRTLAVVPPRLARTAAVVVVATEAAVVPLLVTPWIGALLAIGLLLAFIVAIIRAQRADIVATCPCFGSSTVPLGPRHVVRNLVLIVVASTALAAVVPGRADVDSVGLLLAGTAGIVVASLIVRLDDIVALFADNR